MLISNHGFHGNGHRVDDANVRHDCTQLVHVQHAACDHSLIHGHAYACCEP
ncbi:hypothetical protein [Pseudoalteromonas luteoviolacea]|uniref:hypothetical protein n=1 Tax=Pseudoalteromonas luteoviolacea TaxID=43657 RepID=UPI0012DA8EB1|nr:hypothetical protein [Pseudoalteromonas luteoviolacea]